MFMTCGLTSIRSQKSIAKSCGVSNSTVSRIINHAAQSTKHILMDEFKSVKHVDSAMSFIFAMQQHIKS